MLALVLNHQSFGMHQYTFPSLLLRTRVSMIIYGDIFLELIWKFLIEFVLQNLMVLVVVLFVQRIVHVGLVFDRRLVWLEMVSDLLSALLVGLIK